MNDMQDQSGVINLAQLLLPADISDFFTISEVIQSKEVIPVFNLLDSFDKKQKDHKSMICGLLIGNGFPFCRGGQTRTDDLLVPVSYTHLRAHETDSYLVCRLLLEKK